MSVSPRKLAAIRANLSKAGPLTPDGRRRLRKAILRDEPWRFATGPRSVEGRNRSRMNALKAGNRVAHHRAISAFLTTISRLESMIALLYFSDNKQSINTFCRYSATLGDYVIASRQVRCLPPDTKDTTTCTLWLVEHARLTEEWVPHGWFPLIEVWRAEVPQP